MISDRSAISSQLRSILPAAAVGTALRLWNLRDQVLVGDEVHPIRAALGGDLATVLTTYREADPCLPLTGLYRAMIDAGLPLSELALRLPVLLTGLLTLVLLPLLLAPLAPRASAVFAWLLALSPSLILYSRIVRPYAPIVLWCGLAAGCFWMFWNIWRADANTRREVVRARWAVGGFLVFATLAVWFHLGCAPLVAALFCFALLDLASAPPQARRRLARNLAGTGVALAVVMALPLLPAAASLQQLAVSKRVAQEVPLATYAAVARLQAGTGSAIVAALFWLLALVGWVRLWRTAPRAALFTMTVVLGQLIGIRLLSPIALEAPIAFQRYLLPALPFVLLWFAVAVSPPAPPRKAGRLLPALCLAGLALSGPFTNPATWRTSFLHDAPYVDFSQQPPRPTAESLLQGTSLARPPGRRAIIAAIWPPNRYGSRIFEPAQQIHGRRVIVVSPGLAGHPAVSFRNFVAPDPDAMLATDAQYLVLHAGVPSPPPDPAGAAPAGGRPDWPTELRRRLGDPQWQNGNLQVWDLDAVRASAPQLEETHS